ncbi:glycerol-3-phosphate dehydrogenase, NAD-dependent [Mycobacteroides abscessus subsp. abscessus]|nr:glycerol-3-phosphate dehydrogenase, NAD-dependent [Mycobacteroides abscessus subsp. abscessus]
MLKSAAVPVPCRSATKLRAWPRAAASAAANSVAVTTGRSACNTTRFGEDARSCAAALRNALFSGSGWPSGVSSKMNRAPASLAAALAVGSGLITATVPAALNATAMACVSMPSTNRSRCGAGRDGASRLFAVARFLTAMITPKSVPACLPTYSMVPAPARVSAMATAAVMGAGSWGTALGKVLADAGHDVRLWARRSELADEINATHRNSVYLSDVDLPASLVATGVAEEALQGAELVLLAVPSQSLRANLTPWADLIEPNSSVVSLAKGIEVGTLMRMSQVVTQVLGTDPSRVAVLTGPNLASEIAAGQPAATVIGCTDSTRAVALQRAFSTRYFRPYTNSDVVGCEVGGACKNVIALSCGMAAGVGLGENTIATIITRGLAEITRLGLALGASHTTLAGLAGVGDLVATCTSAHSRNRTFGMRLGNGETLQEARNAAGGRVAEGVTSCESILALASSYDVEMPLTEAVHGVCHRGLSVTDAVAQLLGRSTKPE